MYVLGLISYAMSVTKIFQLMLYGFSFPLIRTSIGIAVVSAVIAFRLSVTFVPSTVHKPPGTDTEICSDSTGSSPQNA